MTIKSCTCRHEFQDKLYGYEKRLMNKTSRGLRCTVCTKEYILGDIKKK